MGQVFDSFVASLAATRRHHAGHPDRELTELLLLALEREQLVSIGYRETLMSRRLDAMPIAPEVRALIRQALLWTWQDEEMHAVYVRGALLKLGRKRLALQAVVRQLAGGLGGWASSVRQHLPWRRSPGARLLAGAVTWIGIITGKVPREIRHHLAYGPFRQFCLFNIDTERTAALCFGRMRELALEAGSSAIPAEDFRRIQADEERHHQLFAVLAQSFEEDDRLAPGVSLAGLASAIGAIDQNFLPRTLRALPPPSDLGSMAKVVVLQAGAADSAGTALLLQILDHLDMATRVRQRAQASGTELSALRVVIKPSFMYAYHRQDPSPITSPALVIALARWLRDLGCRDICVIESPSVYGQFFAGRSVEEVASYVGMRAPEFRLVDASSEQELHHHQQGLGQTTIASSWKHADLRISFGKLRSHPTDEAILTMSNCEWLGASHEELLFTERQAHRQNATIMQLIEYPPHLALLDAVKDVPDGVVGMMGTRHPLTPGRLYGGIDSLAVDAVVSRHCGIADPQSALFVRTACTWLGVSDLSPTVQGIDTSIPQWRGAHHSLWRSLLCLLAFPLYVCASGRGEIFVPAMDERAFPPRARITVSMRLARILVRMLLGLPTRHGAAPATTP